MAFELINTFNIADNANLLLDAAFNPTFASVGGTSFLFVPATGDDGITVFKVTDKGKLKAVDTFADNGTVNLDDVEHVATGVVNGTTFLFADIEGSTRLWGEVPVQLRLALAAHDALVRPAGGEQRGARVAA